MKLKLLLFLLLLSQIQVRAQVLVKKVMIDGEGSPIIMLPGAVAPITTLEIPAKDLALKYKVIRMENLNVQYAAGNSLLPENYSISMESQLVIATLDSLQVTEPAVLVGSSYGGLIALDFAIHHPDRVKAIVLLEPVVFGLLMEKKESPEGFEKLVEVTKELTPRAEITEEQVERWRCLGLNCDSVSVRSLPQWKGWVQTKNRLRGLSATLDYKLDKDLLKNFKKPVLIITGTRTELLHKRINELLQVEMPGSKSVFVESNHSIPTTAPKELVKAILDFLNL